MKLRRKSSESARSRRQRRLPAEDTPAASQPPISYRPRQAGSGPGPETPRNLGRFLAQRFGLVILLVVLVVSVYSVLRLSSSATVVSLAGSSASPFLHDKQVYQAEADKLLAGSIWNHNKITVDTEGISQQMLKQFPELSSVSVTLPLLSQQPTVYVQTAQPALILATSSGSFVVDTTGKALLNADNLSQLDRQKLPVVTDQSGLQAELNHQALSPEDVSFIQTVVAELSARHVGVSSSVLPAGTSELDVHIAGQPYVVKFNLETGDARQQAGTFLATQAKLQSQHVTPSQYIDVRVDGRAYYK